MTVVGELGWDWQQSQLTSDYPWSVVRIASLRADKIQHLLFGWVELYPFDMEAPSGWRAGQKPWSVPGFPGWTCGFSASRIGTADAIRWYDGCAAGKVSISLEAPKPILAHAAEFGPEPVPGRFSVSVTAPFSMPWHDGPRIHRLVPMKRPPAAVVRLGQSPEARDWLRQNLGFDPFADESWLGGVALLAPDPVCASFDVFPSARPSVGGETLSIEAVPRRSSKRMADLSSLSLHIAERRGGAWTDLTTLAIPKSGYAEHQSPQLTGEIGWALVCKDRGLLKLSEPHPWMEQINVSMAMQSAVARVEVPAGGRRKPAQEYEVSTRSVTSVLQVGDPIDDRARSRLVWLHARRHARERREQAPQHLFGSFPSGDQTSHGEIASKKKEAQDFICRLVKQARRRLIFVDPFFGIREVRLFALQNENESVVPRVLTSSSALKTLIGEEQGFQI